MNLFLSHNDKALTRYQDILPLIYKHIHDLETEDQASLKSKTLELEKFFEKEKLKNNNSRDIKHNKNEIALALALAGVASKRTLSLEPFDVQYIGAMTLLEGKVAQMRTGEGKTLTAALAAFVRSLDKKGVHVVTVNEYLARRDSIQMGKLFDYLGKSTGLVYPNQPREEKQQAYFSDITYATNSELGFDFLRSNMAIADKSTYMRNMHFVIVDEVDSILIDEARTPLIISSKDDEKDHLFYEIHELALMLQVGEVIENETIVDRAKKMSEQENSQNDNTSIFNQITGNGGDENGDYSIDKKRKQVHMTEQGFLKAEGLFKEKKLLADDDSLYAVHNLSLLYYLEAALKAQNLFHKNIDYIVKDEQVHIVDEFTGRILKGRRWGSGIHQAIEAKEHVPVLEESKTVATITLQNLFREYFILSGMTGTAKSEAEEFWDIYGLDVIVIPTHKPMVRDDYPDMIFLGAKGKTTAILKDIKERHSLGQPILIGTTSIKASEELSDILKSQNISHAVLNANNHEQEAHIIAQAGKQGSITIATNMAGRGTDIVLGGNFSEEHNAELSEFETQTLREKWQEEHNAVVALGGLHVIGTERHESRRIDDQLRGRAGRQGDPGSSQFYVSFDDELMRLFGTGWAKKTLQVMGMDDNKPLASKMVSKQIEKAQKAVERHNYSMRKELLDFDDVGNEQRKQLYAWRNWLLDQEDTTDKQRQETYFLNLIRDEIFGAVDGISGLMWRDENQFWKELDGIIASFNFQQPLTPETINSWEQEQLSLDEIKHRLWEHALKFIELNDKNWIQSAIAIALSETDESWKEHLGQLDFLRKGIHLRGYAQKQPKQEYKKEAYHLFEAMVRESQRLTSLKVLHIKKNNEQPQAPQQTRTSWVLYKHPSFLSKEMVPVPFSPQKTYKTVMSFHNIPLSENVFLFSKVLTTHLIQNRNQTIEKDESLSKPQEQENLDDNKIAKETLPVRRRWSARDV